MRVSGNLTVPTGLLSDNERAFLRGEKDVENPDQYERNLRYRANQRKDQMAEDLKLLEKEGHEDIVAGFYYKVNRIERLRRELGIYMENVDSETSEEHTDE